MSFCFFTTTWPVQIWSATTWHCWSYSLSLPSFVLATWAANPLQDLGHSLINKKKFKIKPIIFLVHISTIEVFLKSDTRFQARHSPGSTNCDPDAWAVFHVPPGVFGLVLSYPLPPRPIQSQKACHSGRIVTAVVPPAAQSNNHFDACWENLVGLIASAKLTHSSPCTLI